MNTPIGAFDAVSAASPALFRNPPPPRSLSGLKSWTMHRRRVKQPLNEPHRFRGTPPRLNQASPAVSQTIWISEVFKEVPI
jgi:hypothetical protein